MPPRFVIQRVATGEFWSGQNVWSGYPIGAVWFPTSSQAELSALRALTCSRTEWRVRELTEDCNGVDVLDEKLARVNADIRREFAE